jgi:excisionase family DNA binding protein
MSKELQEYYRAAEAAKLLRIGRSTFWRWVADGRLPAGKKLGPRVTVWRRCDVLALIDGGVA